MKRIVSEMQSTTGLFRHRLSFRAFLKLVGFSSLILFLLSTFGTRSTSASASHQSMVVNPAMRLAIDTSSHADIVIMVDNINVIKSYDPVGARFIAAQLFVNQAQPGNRIGIVRIPSSDKPSPVKLLDLTTLQNGSVRSTVKQALTQSFFGPVDPGPTAYFVPALKTASQMLLSAHDTYRKYIIIMTDAIAQSGDQEACSSVSDRYHEWFCEIPTLESHNISVILFAFMTSSSKTELQPTRQYLQQHGGIVLQVG